MTSLSEAPRPTVVQQLSHPKYRPDIDGLRAIAVLSVVAFHAFPSLIKGGFVGVDVFFVISGFLISSIIFGSLEKKSFSFLTFYRRRINRIFPALLLVLAAVWAFGWFTLLADEYMQLGKHIAGGSAFISNFVLLGEAGYFDNSAETKPLLHLWSLGIEEQFYLFWPLLAWAVWKLRINALTLIILMASLSFVLNIIGVQPDPTATFYSPQTRLWELLVGSFLACLTMNKPQYLSMLKGADGPRFRNLQSFAGLTCLVFAFATITKNDPFPGWWALLPTVGAALIIAAGPFAWLNRTILSNRLFVWFGLISFPLYLWHWPLLAFARIVNQAEPSLETRLLAVIASVALAWATLILVERPLQKILNLEKKAASLLALMFLVCLVGLTTYALKGLDSRFPEEIRKIANFNYDFKSDSRVLNCWLSKDQPFDGFKSECMATNGATTDNSVFLWGDSHAGRLYPGLKIILDSKYTLSQFTRDSCPPILNYAYDNCIKSNSFTLSKIAETKPKTVILFAVWNTYQKDWASDSEAKTQLLKTIAALKSSGVRNIIVVGPAPHWPDALPTLVYNEWKKQPRRDRAAIPERILTSSDESAASSDMELSKVLSQQPVTYVSLIGYLCSEKGCLTHIPGKADELFSWDYGHLTTQGAEFVSRHIYESGAFE